MTTVISLTRHIERALPHNQLQRRPFRLTAAISASLTHSHDSSRVQTANLQGLPILFHEIGRRRYRTNGLAGATAPEAGRGGQKRSSTSKDAAARTSRSRDVQESKQGDAKPPEPWRRQKTALQKKLSGQSWSPRKRLSPDALDGIRELHTQDPHTYSTAALATQFEVSPDAIRRILKSKWTPSASERDDRRRRWENRGESIWTRMAELGVKPPKKWRQKGINDPSRVVRKSQAANVSRNLMKYQNDNPTVTDISVSERIL